MPLHVAGLWRYPVKTLAGEAIREALVTADGIPGLPGRARHAATSS
jgi:uncharacterized protein YcbX